MSPRPPLARRTRTINVAAVTRLTFSTTVDGRRVRVALAGELDYRSAADLKDEFDRIVERLAPALVELDLSGLTFVDATGLGLFVGLTRQLRRHDGELRLLDVPPEPMKVLELTGLDEAFDTTAKRPDAPGERAEDASATDS